MPGVIRRNKPLKAKTSLADVTDFTVTNPATGDLLIYDAVDGLWENGKALTGNYTLDGQLSLTDLAIANDLTIGNDLTVSGVITGNLTATTIAATAATIATLTVTGNSSLGGTLSLAGALTGAGFSFSGSGTVAGDLAVTGAVTFGSLILDDINVDDINATGSIVLSGTGYFGGAVQIGGDLSVSGAMGAASVSASGNIDAAGSLIGNELSLYDGAFTAGNWSDGGDPAVEEFRLVSTRYSIPVVLYGEQLITPAVPDVDPAVTATVEMARFDPDGRVVLHYNGTDTFRTAADSIEFWNGASWVAAAEAILALDDVPDVNAPSPTNYQALAWNATAAQWQNRTMTVWFLLDDDLAFMLDDSDNVIQDEAPADA